MKMRIIQQADVTFDLDAEFAGPAIAAAISGESGEDVRDEIMDYTDTERSDMDPDEYVIISGDDGAQLWAGWLGIDANDPPPVSRDALAQLADEKARFADAEQRNDALCEKLARIRQACEKPKDAAGTTQGVVVNGERLASLVLAIISGDGAR